MSGLVHIQRAGGKELQTETSGTNKAQTSTDMVVNRFADRVNLLFIDRFL